MSIINLPENATKAEFAPFLAAGEVAAYSSLDQNGDRYVLNSAVFDDFPGKLGSVVVRFARVMESPAGMRRSMNSKFIGWKKEIVGRVVDVRYSPKRTLVRYDIDPIA